MRARLRRASPRVRRKQRTTWFNGASEGCGEVLTVERCGLEIFPSDPDLFTLVDNPASSAALGTVGDGEEVTLLRTVGEIVLNLSFVNINAPASWYELVTVYMGIYIADADASGAVIIRDPSKAEDMPNKDWLWRGTWGSSQCNLIGNTTFTCTTNFDDGGWAGHNGSHIDVKVKRKLRPEESIVLAFRATHDDVLAAGGTAFSLLVQANIRCLIKYS